MPYSFTVYKVPGMSNMLTIEGLTEKILRTSPITAIFDKHSATIVFASETSTGAVRQPDFYGIDQQYI